MTDTELEFKEKEIDTEDFIREVQKLPEEHRKNIFYMMKGYQLLCTGEKDVEIA